MSTAPFWPVEIDSMVAHTTELTPETFGAYLLLMMAQWRNNGRPLPDKDQKLARICRLTPRRWKQVVRPAIENYFHIYNGTWSQKRVVKDFENVAIKIRKNRENAARGGKAKALNTKNRSLANATNSPSESVDAGETERPSDRLTKDESEGRRIPPPFGRERGNPSSECGDDAERKKGPPSMSRDGNGLHEGTRLKARTIDAKDDSAFPIFDGQRPSEMEIAAWKNALRTLHLRGESNDYKHLEQLELIAVDGNTVTLCAPNQLIRDRASELGGRIRDALQDAGLAIATVCIEVPDVSAKRP